MNTRAKTQSMIDSLNARLGILNAQWNTPRAYMLNSYKPGNRRIYQLERNTDDDRGGCTTLISGDLKDVRSFVDAMILGYDLAKDRLKKTERL